MKKVLQSLMLLAIICLPMLLEAQSRQTLTTTVADGTATNEFVPVYGYYCDEQQRTQVIYPAAMLTDMVAGDSITAMHFYVSSGSSANWSAGVFTVSLANTTQSSLSSNWDATTTTAVYTGNLIADAEGGMTVTFTTPFEYTGGNLLVAFELPTSIGYTRCYFLGVEAAGGGREAHGSSYTTAAGTVRNFIPKCDFTYRGIPATCPKPTDVVISNTTAYGATISWTSTASNFVVAYGTGNVIDSMATVNATGTTVTLSGLTPATTYNVFVKAVCSATEESAWSNMASFTTGCVAINQFPWIENFDSYEAATVDPWFQATCWTNTHVSGNGNKLFGIYTSTQSGNATPKLFLPDQTSGTYTHLLLPEMDFGTANSHRLTLSVLRNATGTTHPDEGIRIYATPDGTVENGIELAFISRNSTVANNANIPAETASGWYTYELTIPIASGHILLQGESKFGSATYLDNFVIDQLPTCPKPTQPMLLSASTNTATVSWTNNSTATQFLVAYGQGTDVNTMTTILVNADSAAITGLTQATTYHFYVKAVCSATDESEWSAMGTFRTECGLAALPFVENFEGYATGSSSSSTFIPCWGHASDNTTSPGYPYVSNSSSYNHTDNGTGGLYWYSPSTTSYTYSAIMLPEIDVNIYPMNGNTLAFWAKSSSTSYKPMLFVGVVTDPTDAETFQVVDTLYMTQDGTATGTGNTTWTKYEFDLANYTGNGAYAAIVAPKPTSNWYAYVDDISLYKTPTCFYPTDVQAQAISTSAATVTWTPRDSASQNFQIAYGTVNNIDSMIVDSANSTTTTLYGLMDNTTYYVRVRTICSATDTSDWSEVVASFKTFCLTAASPVFADDFESYTGSEMPDCWLQGWFYRNPGTGAKTQPFQTATTYHHSGSRAMTLQDQATGTSSWVSTNLMSIDRGGKYEISLWVNRQSASGHPLEGIKLWLTPTPGDTTNAEFLGEIHRHYGAAPAESTTGWYNYTFPINVTGNRALMIQGYSTYGNATYFDDLEIREIPCEKDVTYAENFESQDDLNIPVCWDNSASTTSTATTSNGHYVWGTYTYNGNRMIRMNNYWCSNGIAAINTPQIVLDTMANYEFVFDYSHHASCGSFYVKISNDGGATFTDAATFGSTNTGNSYQDPVAFEQASIDLTSYAGDTIILQFFANANYGNGAIFVDNIAVREINNCPIPTNVTVELINASSASVEITPADSTQNTFLLAYGTGTNPNLMDTMTVIGTTATLNGLALETTYNVFAKALCGEGSESYWSSMASIFVGYCTPAPTSVDGQGITHVTFGNFPETVDNTNRPTSSPFYGNYTNMIGAVAAATTANVSITYATEYTYGTIIWVDWNKNLTFDGNEVVYVGESSADSPTTLNASFFIPATVDTGVYRMRIIGTDSGFDDYTGSIANAANANPCYSGSYTVAHDYSLRVTEAPQCMPLQNVSVSNITTNSAEISWTVTDTAQHNFVVAYGQGTDPDAMAQVTATATTITLTGLDATTSYNVFVKAVCSATDQSTWSSASFLTATCEPEDQCIITFTMSDQYSDSWNGASISLVDSATNLIVGNVTLADGIATGTETLNVCPGRTYSLIWNGGFYDNECSFTVTDVRGQLIFTGTHPYSTLLTTFVANCDAAPATADSINITVVAADTTMGTTLGTGRYEVGENVTIAAIANAGFHFVSWNDADTNATRTIVADTADMTFVATFAANGTSTDDTIRLVMTNYNIQSFAGEHYIQLDNNNYTFIFDIYADSLVSGVTYTFNDMDEDYSFAVYNDESYIEYASAQYTETHNGDTLRVHATVTDLNGNIYDITYSEVISIDTINIQMANYTMVYDNTEMMYLATFISADSSYLFLFGFENQPVNNTVYTFGTTFQAIGIDVVSNSYIFPTAGTYVQTTTATDFVINATLSNARTVYQITYSEPLPVIVPDSINITVVAADTTMGTTLGTGRYEVGENVTIAAIANAGFHFVSWNDADTNATRTIVADTADMTFVATFAADVVIPDTNYYTVTLTVNDTTMGTVTGAGIYAEGSVVTISAIANEGYEFVNWSDSDTNATRTLTINADITLAATFQANTVIPDTNYYTVTLAVNDTTMGTVTGAGVYAEGAEITISAIANEGFVFVSWSDGDTNATRTITVTSDIELTAEFRANEVSIYDVENINAIIYTRNTTIVVKGAEQQTIRVFDVNGRVLATRSQAPATAEFNMPATGIYFVKVGNQAAQRVLIVR